MLWSVWLLEVLPAVAAAFILGAVLGSWLNVCIHRFPQHQTVAAAWASLWWPPSHCPKCKSGLRWRDNIPIFGWLILRGRCHGCRATIPARYVFVEIITASLFALIVFCEIGWLGNDPYALDHPYAPQSLNIVSECVWPVSLLGNQGMQYARIVLHLLLVLALVAATFIDLDLLIIPDCVTLPMMAAGVIFNTLLGGVYTLPVWFSDPATYSFADAWFLVMGNQLQSVPAWAAGWFDPGGVPAWIPAHPHLHGFLFSVTGILVGGGVVWGVRTVGYWAMQREAMGFGDVVLLAMVGSVLGWQMSLLVFILAPFMALFVAVAGWLMYGNREIPYGPYLSLASVVSILAFQKVWPSAAVVFSLSPAFPVLIPGGLVLMGATLWLMQAVRHRMGWIDDEQLVAEWLPGDQLAYLAGENNDPQQGRWRKPNEWQGVSAARGNVAGERWRYHSRSSR